ncbi:MAG: hypothetical protein HKO93_06615, partial [Flavobacteriales bacterium]|nr:hypothetical protein [Flavobacteriales bacterium]
MEKDVSYLKIFEGPNTDIYYLSNHAIFAIWHGYLDVESIRESGEAILTAAQNFNCRHIMNDNRRILDTKPEALKWIEDQMMPQIVELGIKRVAHIYPSHLIRNKSMDRLLSIQHDSMIKVFSSFTDASVWLKGYAFNNLPSDGS